MPDPWHRTRMPRILLPCLALVLATACDSKPAETKPADAKPTESKSADAKTTETKTTETKPTTPDEAKPTEAKAEPAASAAASPPASDAIERYGSCKVSVTGAVTKTFEAPGSMSALGSDYFMNDEEMRKALTVLSGADGVEEAMKQDPRIYTLLVNCVADGLNLNFVPGKGSTYADVPFGPKRYEIKTGREDGKGKMMVMLSIDGQLYSPAPGGSFEVTKLDKTGLAGTFSFEATGMVGTAGKIQVSGTVDYKCAHDTAMCREGRGE